MGPTPRLFYLSAVKQEIDRNEDMLRSCLRAVDSLAKLPNAAQVPLFKHFMDSVVLGPALKVRGWVLIALLHASETGTVGEARPVGPPLARPLSLRCKTCRCASPEPSPLSFPTRRSFFFLLFSVPPLPAAGQVPRYQGREAGGGGGCHGHCLMQMPMPVAAAESAVRQTAGSG
jgi:hypothetical protein